MYPATVYFFLIFKFLINILFTSSHKWHFNIR